MADLLLNNSKGYWDIDFENGDFALTEGLETALLMSIYVDKRAAASEVPRVQARRGWHGNLLSGFDTYEIGSKLWLLCQARRDQNTLNLTQTYTSDCLFWLVTDSIATKIETDASFIVNGVAVYVTIYRSQNEILNKSYILWNNTDFLE